MAIVSDNVTLLLHTIASPRPTFKWFKLENGMSKKLGETKPKIFTNAMAVGECILSNVGVCDSGEYRVVVHNGVGADFVMDYTVEVQGKDTGFETWCMHVVRGGGGMCPPPSLVIISFSNLNIILN